jgi:hypothetical protein
VKAHYNVLRGLMRDWEVQSWLLFLLLLVLLLLDILEVGQRLRYRQERLLRLMMPNLPGRGRSERVRVQSDSDVGRRTIY